MTTANKALLRITEARVCFGNVAALDGVSLALMAGERVALLGHNGAGKSTLFRAILGFVPLAAGSIGVEGHRPGAQAARQGIGYLPEAIAFPKSLSGAEIITFYAQLKGADLEKSLALLERLGIAHAAHRQVGTYSKGMRQRLGLAQALIGHPQLLLLDEPTSGLDPLSRRDLYAIISEAVESGTSVLHSSHSLNELEGHTDRIAILSNGRLVAEGTQYALAQKAQLPVRLRITTREGRLQHVRKVMGGKPMNAKGLVVSCPPDGKLALIARLAGLADDVQDFEMVPPSLDDVYEYFSHRDQGEVQP